MNLVIIVALCFGITAVAVTALERKLVMLMDKVKTLETALNGVKPTLEEHARLANEVRDIRTIVDELPVEEIVKQAEYEKMYAESLEAINNYSVEVAMGGGERN